MADDLEKIRSVATEVLDRENDISRVAQSGPWPAFVLETQLWVPRRVFVGRVSPELFPPQFWLLLRSRGSPAGEARFRDFVQRTSRFAEVTEIDFSPPNPGGSADKAPRRTILVNGADESGVLDRTGFTTLDQARLIRTFPVPSSDVLARWGELELSLSEERERQRRERDASQQEREQRNERLCHALLSHLARDVFPCPFCGRSSQNYRYLGSHFICWDCGRSFFPADLPPGTIPSP
jgi:predicted RNA-binding Zn-ribbon protein involved in translation (DUF1610 family)